MLSSRCTTLGMTTYAKRSLEEWPPEWHGLPAVSLNTECRNQSSTTACTLVRESWPWEGSSFLSRCWWLKDSPHSASAGCPNDRDMNYNPIPLDRRSGIESCILDNFHQINILCLSSVQKLNIFCDRKYDLLLYSPPDHSAHRHYRHYTKVHFLQKIVTFCRRKC